MTKSTVFVLFAVLTMQKNWMSNYETSCVCCSFSSDHAREPSKLLPDQWWLLFMQFRVWLCRHKINRFVNSCSAILTTEENFMSYHEINCNCYSCCSSIRPCKRNCDCCSWYSSGFATEIVIVFLAAVLAVQPNLCWLFLLHFWPCKRNCNCCSYCSSGCAREWQELSAVTRFIVIVVLTVLRMDENGTNYYELGK